MPDFRVDDTAPDHRKLRAAGLPAIGLWSMAGAWAMRELTDGWVPAYYVHSWPAGARHAAALVRCGLWRAEQLDGIKGYRFHDWKDFQRTRHQIEKDRADARERMRQLRATAPDVRANTARTSTTRAEHVHDALPPLPRGGSVGSSTHDRAGASAPPVDADVIRRGVEKVRSELDAARARRVAREADAG